MNFINNTFRRLLNSRATGRVRQEFLPDDECLDARLRDICRSCPRAGGCDPLPREGEEVRLHDCRKRFFGVLLEFFAGKPGEEEIDRLYAYLEGCERCRPGARPRNEITLTGERQTRP